MLILNESLLGFQSYPLVILIFNLSSFFNPAYP